MLLIFTNELILAWCFLFWKVVTISSVFKIDIDLLILFSFSSMSFSRLCLSRNWSILLRLSNFLAQTCSQCSSITSNIHGVCHDVSYLISDIHNLRSFSSFLVNLLRGWSILLIFSKNELSILLIFSNVFLFVFIIHTRGYVFLLIWERGIGRETLIICLQ